tara:strand:- start:2445 stop:2939 length:495 start_codon:yes stop_codon:yes gene_type:complete
MDITTWIRWILIIGLIYSKFKSMLYLMKRTIKGDYQFGRKYETIVMNYLNEKFNKSYQLNPERYGAYDFFNDKDHCELKTRKCTHNRYNTTIFGATKVDKMDKEKNNIFYFLFTDGLYRWLYNEKECFTDTNGRVDRGRPEFAQHINIPIEHLELVTEELSSSS